MSDTIKILFLSSNPCEDRPLDFGREVRGIVEAIRKSPRRDALEFVTEWAVRTGDLQGALLLHEPGIVHFSGHGQDGEGILLEDQHGAQRAVDGATLRELFTILRRSIRVVVLNACESLPTIEAFRDIIDYTIGMSAPISDPAAMLFAEAFYGALASGAPVADAFGLGVNRVRMEGSAEADIPRLLVREGADRTPLCAPREPPREAPRGEGSASITMTGNTVANFTPVWGNENTINNTSNNGGR
jgi:hypothetical protein